MENNTLKIYVPDGYITDLDLTLYRTDTAEYGIIIKKDGVAIYNETGITATTKNIDLPNEAGDYTVFITHTSEISFNTSPYVRWTVDIDF